jgi:hypothetical protein
MQLQVTVQIGKQRWSSLVAREDLLAGALLKHFEQ